MHLKAFRLKPIFRYFILQKPYFYLTGITNMKLIISFSRHTFFYVEGKHSLKIHIPENKYIKGMLSLIIHSEMHL